MRILKCDYFQGLNHPHLTPRHACIDFRPHQEENSCEIVRPPSNCFGAGETIKITAMVHEPPLKRQRKDVCAVAGCHKRNGTLKPFNGESEVTQRLEYDSCSGVMCSIHYKAHLASQKVTTSNNAPELCRTDFNTILKFALPYTYYYLKSVLEQT